MALDFSGNGTIGPEDFDLKERRQILVAQDESKRAAKPGLASEGVTAYEEAEDWVEPVRPRMRAQLSICRETSDPTDLPSVVAPLEVNRPSSPILVVCVCVVCVDERN